MRIMIILTAVVAALSTPAQGQQAASVAAPNAQDRITVEVQGSGPDVILIPGLASSTAVWSSLAENLRNDHRIHLVQIAGFAGTPALADPDSPVAAPAAEAIANYIARENLHSPAVIGHSLGGEVGLMLAARHEGLIGRLMVVDALPFFSLLMNPSATVEGITPQARAFRNMLLSAPEAQTHAMQTATIARLVKTESVRPELVEANLASDRETVASATYELMTTDLRGELGRITVPVEVVYAYDSAYGVPAEQIDATFHDAYAEADTATFRRIDDSFHFVMIDQPQAFAEAVYAFLAEKR